MRCAGTDKQLLVINWDETACRLHYSGGRGFCTRAAEGDASSQPRLMQHAPTSRKRGSLTHVALVCTDSAIQPKLPQIVMGNERTLTAGELTAIEGQNLPPNVQVWRRKSAWVTKDSMREILKEIWKCVRPYQKERQVVLLLDSHPCHLDPKFLANCVRKKIWVVFVPAKLTWLLQPLDTHAFSVYKRVLRADYCRLVQESATGRVSVAEVVGSIGRTIRKVLHRKVWKTAFEQNGFTTGTRRASKRVLSHLQWSHPPKISSELPSFAQFESMLPSRMDLPLRELTAPFRNLPIHAPGRPPCPPPPRPATSVCTPRESMESESLPLAVGSSEVPVPMPCARPPLPRPPWSALATASRTAQPSSPARTTHPRLPVGRPLHPRRSHSWQ